MGKVIEKIKVINVFEPEREIELEAVIDTGATMLVLPQNVIDKLNLRKMREVKVRYANNKTEIKSIYGVVTVEMCGRAGEFNVLAEPEGAQPLVGQIILEQLDLIVDPSTRKVIPNPRSPDMPMVEVLMATPPNSGSLTLIQTPPRQGFAYPQYAISTYRKRREINATFRCNHSLAEVRKMLGNNDVDVVILGDAYIDFIFLDVERYPLPGEEIIVKEFELRAGGSAGYTAIALATLGLKVGVISNIGNDFLSSWWLDFLSNLGVNTTFIKIIKSSRIGAGCVFLHRNDRSFITFRGANQINRELPLPDNIHTKFLLVTGFSQAPYLWQSSLFDFLKGIRQRDIKIALDTNWSIGDWQELFKKILQYIDFLIINEKELKKFAKSNDIYDAAERLMDMGVRTCIIKRGELGCKIIGERGSQDIPTQKVRAVDLNGAGDFFNAGFIYAYLKKGNIKTACQFANKCARIAISHFYLKNKIINLKNLRGEIL